MDKAVEEIKALRPRPEATLPNLATPSTAYRARHVRTVATLNPDRSAIRELAIPSPAINNTRARRTSRSDAVCEAAKRVRISRSPSVNGNGSAGACMTQVYPA